MKKVVSIILAFCIMALVSCTEKKVESHTDEKQTSTAETTTTTLDVTEDDTNVFIDPINVPDYATKKFDKIYEIKLEKIAENEYKTPDGYFDIKIEYELKGHSFKCKSTWKNTSNKTLKLDAKCIASVKTDIPNDNANSSNRKIDSKYVKMIPGEEIERSDSQILAPKYTTANAAISISGSLGSDDNGNSIEYITDPDPLITFEYTR